MRPIAYVLIALSLAATAAGAGSIASAAEATTATSSSFVATWPWGDWLAAVAGFVGEHPDVVIGLVFALLARTPLKWAVQWLQTEQVEQVLARAVTAGANGVRGVMEGERLTVDVGSAVVARALQYAIDCAPAMVHRLGGPEAVAARILARVTLDDEAALTPADIKAIAAAAVAGKEVSGKAFRP